MGKRPNRYLIKEDIQMASKHMKICSTPYVIRELQIKTKMRYHDTPIRMAKIHNSDNECWPGYGVTELSFTVYGNAKWVAMLETAWKFLVN